MFESETPTLFGLGYLPFLIFYALLISIFELIGQVNEKRFFDDFVQNNYHIHFILITFVSYFCISYLLSVSYGFRNMGTINQLWSATSIIIFAMYGYIIGETFTLRQIMGLIISIIAITIIVVETYNIEMDDQTEENRHLIIL